MYVQIMEKWSVRGSKALDIHKVFLKLCRSKQPQAQVLQKTLILQPTKPALHTESNKKKIKLCHKFKISIPISNECLKKIQLYI